MLNVGMGFVENLSRPMVFALAILPTVVGLVIYFLMRASKLAPYRALAVVPLAGGITLGVQALNDLSRPGVKEYGDVGSKTLIVYACILVIPILAMAWLAFYELKSRRSGFHRQAH